MKSRRLKKIMVIVLSASLVCGSCSTVFASQDAAAADESVLTEEDSDLTEDAPAEEDSALTEDADEDAAGLADADASDTDTAAAGDLSADLEDADEDSESDNDSDSDEDSDGDSDGDSGSDSDEDSEEDSTPEIIDGVVQIETAEDFVWFAAQASAGEFYDAVLLNDVDLSGNEDFRPVGYVNTNTVPYCYTKTFDGNGYTITLNYGESSSIRSYSALFGGLGDNGVIRDLTVEGSVLGYRYTAGVVAYATGGRIENVTANVALSGSEYAVAGIVSYVNGEIELYHCVNYGTVTSSPSKYYMAGILGFGTGEQIVVTGCINYGDVTNCSEDGAGIVGGTTAEETRIVGCINYGAVTASSDNGYMGGILGVNDPNENYTATLIACVNYGDVTATHRAGGVVGFANKDVELLYCGNEGAVTGEYSTGTSNLYYVAGLIGVVWQNFTADSCYNSGSVTHNGMSNASGLVGYAPKSGSSLTNSYNTGSVAVYDRYASGISAVYNADSVLQNCYNAGTVSYTESEETDTGLAALVHTMYVDSDGSPLSAISGNYTLEGTGSGLFIKFTSLATLNSTTLDIADSNGCYVSSEVLQTLADTDDDTGSSVLGDAYTAAEDSVNDGYPVLVWQKQTAEEVTAMIEEACEPDPYGLDAIEQAMAAYADLSQEEQAKVTSFEELLAAYENFFVYQEEAAGTIALIDAIGEVTLESEAAITEAEESYNALSEEGQCFVTNADTLTEARSAYNVLYVQYLIGQIGEVTVLSGDAITAARDAYDALSDAQKALLTEELAVLEDAENTYTALFNAETVIELIDAIGEVTLESGTLISAARTGYEGLSEEAKAYVTNLSVLEEAESVYAVLLAIQEVEELIDAIGEVTHESGDLIDAAREAYEALDESAQASVSNLDVLEAAETAYVYACAAYEVDEIIAQLGDAADVTLDSGDAIEAARAAYEALEEGAKAYIENLSLLEAAEEAYAVLLAIQETEDLIDAIGDVTYESGSLIEAAREAYEALDESAQASVENLDVLEAAEELYAIVSAAHAVDLLIEAIGDVSLESGDAIDAARSAYELLRSAEQAYVTELALLEEAEELYEMMQEAYAVDVLIEAIGEVTEESYEAIYQARLAYEYLSDEAKAYVTQLDTLTAAESAYAAIVSGSASDGLTQSTVGVQAPKVKSVSNAANGVSVTWSSCANAYGYYIYRSQNGGAYKLVATLTAADVSYTDKKAVNGASYTYMIIAYNGNTVSSAGVSGKITYLKQAAIKKLKNKKGKKATVTVAKNAKASGYVIVYSTSKNFKSKKTVTVKKASKVKTTLKKLKKNKKYYVKVRSYKKSGSSTVYSAWSSVKSVKIKK